MIVSSKERVFFEESIPSAQSRPARKLFESPLLIKSLLFSLELLSLLLFHVLLDIVLVSHVKIVPSKRHQLVTIIGQYTYNLDRKPSLFC
jgi:hypothetical protein